MHIRFVFLNLFLFLLFSKSDDEFDEIAKYIKRSIHVKITAFRNQLSRGINKGCCGVKQDRYCLPCQFRFELVSIGYDSDLDKDLVKKTVLGISSKPSDYLIENYENSFFLDPIVYNRHLIEIYSLQYSSAVLESFPKIESYKITKFLYQGNYGTKNFIELWGEIQLGQINKNENFFTGFIRVDSIFWINFKTFENQCCIRKQSYECEDECDYSIQWKNEDNYLESVDISPLNNERKVNVSGTVVSTDDNLQKNSVNFEVELKSTDLYETIDTIIFPNIKVIPNIEYHLLNAIGTYGNVILNISWMYNCLKSRGINCANECQSDEVIASCDPIIGKQFCLNGAIDFPACEKLNSNCEVSPCKNNGSCFVDSGKVYCSCLNGYFGQICQDWQCDSRCNGNGICVGPNLCNCIPPYIGKDCEGSLCLEKNEKKCGKNGICILVAGIKTCICTNSFFTGENCSEVICNPECIFGVCRYSKYLESSRCVCNEQYAGVKCDTPIKASIKHQYPGSFIAPLVVLVLILISLIVIYGLTFTGIIHRFPDLKIKI